MKNSNIHLFHRFTNASNEVKIYVFKMRKTPSLFALISSEILKFNLTKFNPFLEVRSSFSRLPKKHLSK